VSKRNKTDELVTPLARTNTYSHTIQRKQCRSRKLQHLPKTETAGIGERAVIMNAKKVVKLVMNIACISTDVVNIRITQIKYAVLAS
jgi:hypothetical protein